MSPSLTKPDSTSPRAQRNVYVGGERGGGGGARLRRKEQTSAGAQGKMRCELQGHTTGSTTRRTDGRVHDRRAAAKGTRKKVELSGIAAYHLSAQSSSPSCRGRWFTDRQTDRHSHARTTQRGQRACVWFRIWWSLTSRFKIHQQLHPAKGGGQRVRGFPASASPGSSHRPKTCTSH